MFGASLKFWKTLTLLFLCMWLISVGTMFWLNERVIKLNAKASELEGELKAANVAGEMCSASIKGLRLAAEENHKRFEAEVLKAQAENVKRQTRAVGILSTPPSHPHDSCLSVDRLAQDWHKERSR